MTLMVTMTETCIHSSFPINEDIVSLCVRIILNWLFMQHHDMSSTLSMSILPLFASMQPRGMAPVLGANSTQRQNKTSN